MPCPKNMQELAEYRYRKQAEAVHSVSQAMFNLGDANVRLATTKFHDKVDALYAAVIDLYTELREAYPDA